MYQDELESFKKDGHILMGEKFIPVLNTETPLDNVGNTPVVIGFARETEVKMLRHRMQYSHSKRRFGA